MNVIDFREKTKINPQLKVKTRDTRIIGSLKKIIVHCTDAPSWSPEKLSNFFVDERKFPCCSYHYYIMDDAIYHMVGDGIITYHAGNDNKYSLGVAIDFHATAFEKLNVRVADSIMTNLKELSARLCIEYKIYPDKILGHRESINILSGFGQHDLKHLKKTCPGLSVDLNLLRFNVIMEIQKLLNVTIDGIFGPKTKSAFDEIKISLGWL